MGLLSNYLCRYLRCIVHIYMCVCVCVISELHSVERQSKLPVDLKYERFCFINNRHRRLFAWRHQEAGQYVAQSGLHLHQSEPHSCEEKKRTAVRYFEMQVDFYISLSSPPVAFNKIYFGDHYRYNNIGRRQETNLSDLRNFILKFCKNNKYLEYLSPEF